MCSMHRPRDAHSVKGGGAAADLVEDEQAVFGSALQNLSHLAHLHHEGGLARGQVIRCAHAGIDAVHHADLRRPCRHIGADLRHQHNQRHLAHVGGFARHVRAGDDGDLVFRLVQEGVVCHKQGVGEHLFHHRVAAILNVNLTGKVDVRPAVVLLERHRGKTGVQVQPGDGVGGRLHAVNLPGHLGANLDRTVYFPAPGSCPLPPRICCSSSFNSWVMYRSLPVRVCLRMYSGGTCDKIGLGDLQIVAKDVVIIRSSDS